MATRCRHFWFMDALYLLVYAYIFGAIAALLVIAMINAGSVDGLLPPNLAYYSWAFNLVVVCIFVAVLIKIRRR